MKLFNVILVLIILNNFSLAQIVNFVPNDRPIYILGGCVKPPIECKIITSQSIYDSVKITAPFGGLCIFDSTHFNYRSIRECVFLVNNIEKSLSYELWGVGITMPGYQIQFPFNTQFYAYPNFYFDLKLIVKKGLSVVDSMIVLFKSDIQGDVEDFQSSMNCSLSQNYPNPFNSSTVFSYELKVKSAVKLKVYDILGRKIATLVDAEKPPGIHEVQFNNDNSHTSSGVYFYELKVGEYRIMKKMSLIR